VVKKPSVAQAPSKTVGVSLDVALTALQKSFSRVNSAAAKSLKENPGEPVARLEGDITFEMKTRVEPEGNRLIITKNGQIDLSISGTIDPDIEDDVRDPDDKGDEKG